MKALLTVDEALAAVLERVRPVPTEPVALENAAGGVVPEGADAVIPIEYVVEHDNRIEIAAPVEPAASVRPRGGDVVAGEVVVSAGTRLGPAQIGALAAAGLNRVSCSGRPRAAVVT